MPGDAGVLVVTRVRSITTTAHEAAGATGARHSPRPQRGREINANLGRMARRGRGRAFGEYEYAVIFVKRSDDSPQTPSFRDGPKDQTRNLEIPGSCFACPGMTVMGLRAEPVIEPHSPDRFARNDHEASAPPAWPRSGKRRGHAAKSGEFHHHAVAGGEPDRLDEAAGQHELAGGEAGAVRGGLIVQPG